MSGLSIVKDMALTLADFKRGLDAALHGLEYRMDDRTVVVGDASRGVRIEVTPLPARRLGGLFVVEHAEVKIDFQHYDAAEQEAFLKQFDQAYQRGGG